MRIEDLKRKEVINCCNCKILGCADDIAFDICTGCIEALIVPGPTKFCNLICSDFEYIIPVKCVKQIGDDIILVSVDLDEVKHKYKTS